MPDYRAVAEIRPYKRFKYKQSGFFRKECANSLLNIQLFGNFLADPGNLLVEIELIVQLDTQELHCLLACYSIAGYIEALEFRVGPTSCCYCLKFSRVCLHSVVVKPFQSYFTLTFNYAFEDSQLSMYKRERVVISVVVHCAFC